MTKSTRRLDLRFHAGSALGWCAVLTAHPIPARRLRAVALWIAAAVVWSGSAASAQQLTAQVDRTEIADNETLTLEVVYRESAPTDSFDFDALLPDFSVIAVRPTSQTRFENFSRTSQTAWRVTLMPKRVGVTSIPSFVIGSERTRPITIRVRPAAPSAESGAPFSVEASIDRDRVFVGEQVLLQIRLNAARSVSDLRGAPPEIENAETTLVSQSEFRKVLGGQSFNVTELVYAIFPKTPGQVEIPVLQYQATVRRARLVVARTQSLEVEVRDPATHPEAGRKSPWLPASAVALSSEWSGDTDALRVGEPVTRTLRIIAASQYAAAIVPPRPPEGPFKLYPEQPELADSQAETGILGSRTESVVFVPTEAGTLELPPVEIDWWDIDEGRWRVARLPGEILRVAPQADAGAPAANPVTDSIVTEELAEPIAANRPPATITIALGVLCLLLFGCCVVLFMRVRRLEAGRPSGRGVDAEISNRSRPSVREAAAFQRIARAIASRDAAQVRQDLLTWARLKWPDGRVSGLDAIGDLVADDELRGLLRELDASLYRDRDVADDRESGDLATTESRREPEDTSRLDWSRLEECLARIRGRKDVASAQNDSVLPPLYPTES